MKVFFAYEILSSRTHEKLIKQKNQNLNQIASSINNLV